MSQCSESPPSDAVSGGGAGEIMLFGVRVKVDPMRKSASMNNLSDYEAVVNNNSNLMHNNDETAKAAAEDGFAAGYVTADDAVPMPINGSRDRKRGVPWTEEEHKLFLIGLQKVGKGDWRGISRNYVKTRTPTQVASHAQKYFLRRSNLNRRRRRSSLFDITTDSVTAMPVEKGKSHQESPTQPPSMPLNSNATGFSVLPYPVTMGPVLFSMQTGNSVENSAVGQTDLNNSSPMLVRPVPVHPMATPSPMVDLNLMQQVSTESSPLSLRLSLSSSQDQLMRDSGFQVTSSFQNGDIISVA